MHKHFVRWAHSGVWDRIFAKPVKGRNNEYLKIDSKSTCWPTSAVNPSLPHHRRTGERLHLGGGVAGRRVTEAVINDKGYDSDSILTHVKAIKAEAVIHSRSCRKKQRQHTSSSINSAIASKAALAD